MAGAAHAGASAAAGEEGSAVGAEAVAVVAAVALAVAVAVAVAARAQVVEEAAGEVAVAEAVDAVEAAAVDVVVGAAVAAAAAAGVAVRPLKGEIGHGEVEPQRFHALAFQISRMSAPQHLVILWHIIFPLATPPWRSCCMRLRLSFALQSSPARGRLLLLFLHLLHLHSRALRSAEM
jgi:hypothetical protein